MLLWKLIYNKSELINSFYINIAENLGKPLRLLRTVTTKLTIDRSSHQKVLLGKGVLKICSKFTGEHPCQSVISIKLQANFIEIALQHGCSPVNLLHIFTTSFLKNTSGWLLLNRETVKLEFYKNHISFSPLSVSFALI